MFEVLQIKFAPNSKFSKFKDETEITLAKFDASFHMDTLKTISNIIYIENFDLRFK